MGERIKLEDTLKDVIIKMSEGNPGAMKLLMDMLQYTSGLERILDLDTMGIYGSQIWVGYKNHCGSDIENFLKTIKRKNPILKMGRR